jgi:hypothetical protein
LFALVICLGYLPWLFALRAFAAGTFDHEAAPGIPVMACWIDLDRLRKTRDAHDQSVDPQAATGKDLSRKGAPSWCLPAETGRLHTRLHDNAEKPNSALRRAWSA